MIGLGNIAQVVGYKTGSLFGGGFLGWLSSWYSWQWLFFLLFVMYGMSAFLVCSHFFINVMFPQILQPNDIGKTHVQNAERFQPNSSCINHNETHYNQKGLNFTDDKSKESSAMEMNKVTKRQKYQDMVKDEKMQSASSKDSAFLSQKSRNFVKVKLEQYLTVYQNVLESEGTKWIIVYVLIYKLGEQGMIAIFPMFLLDQGVSSSDTAMLTGVLCQFCSIFGSLIGGMIFSYW
jgi:MFS family permease